MKLPAVGPHDLGVSRAEYAAAATTANDRIVAGNECNAAVRAEFAKGGSDG